MIYHYCRVSTKDQNLDRQFEALSAYKQADKVYSDKMSGKNFERVSYQQLKRDVRPGDEVIIKELDRLGRNKDGIKEELAWFRKQGVTVRVLDVPTTLIDFNGQDWVQDMVNNVLIEVLGAIAEQERNKIKSRQMEGINAKRNRPDWSDYGRPECDIDRDEFDRLVELNRSGVMTVADCCKRLNISRGTWYNRLAEHRQAV